MINPTNVKPIINKYTFDIDKSIMFYINLDRNINRKIGLKSNLNIII